MKLNKGDLIEIFWKDAVQKKVSQDALDKEISGFDFLADKITYGKFEKEFKTCIAIIHEYCPEDDRTDESVDLTFVPKCWITKILKNGKEVKI